MFRLAGAEFPSSTQELTIAIRAGLEEVFVLPPTSKTDRAVRHTGGRWPRVETLTVDLSNAGVKLGSEPLVPVASGTSSRGLTLGKLHATGHPVRYGDAVLSFDLRAQNVALDFNRDADNTPMLLLADAEHGHFEVTATRADLIKILLGIARTVGEQHGVAVLDADLSLRQVSDQAIGFAAKFTVKKGSGFLSAKATMHAGGEVAVSPNLTATFTNLTLRGEGMFGAVAEKIARPYVEQYNGKSVPLDTLGLGNVTLREVKLRVEPSFALTAEFAGEKHV
jgi:hypothetical protein